jgi:UDP-N-acetylmuramoyl-tripeptide--D-alanyl-D-alanine ligase
MFAALSILADIRENRSTIAVLGDMLELGDTAHQAHLEVGAHVQQLGIDTLITRGELARVIGEGALQHGMARAKVVATATNGEAERTLLSHLTPQSVVLIKGSRGMAMEEIVAGLKHHLMG